MRWSKGEDIGAACGQLKRGAARAHERRAATVAFATLGCRLNQVDTQEIQALLEGRGFRTVAVRRARRRASS